MSKTTVQIDTEKKIAYVILQQGKREETEWKNAETRSVIDDSHQTRLRSGAQF